MCSVRPVRPLRRVTPACSPDAFARCLLECFFPVCVLHQAEKQLLRHPNLNRALSVVALNALLGFISPDRAGGDESAVGNKPKGVVVLRVEIGESQSSEPSRKPVERGRSPFAHQAVGPASAFPTADTLEDYSPGVHIELCAESHVFVFSAENAASADIEPSPENEVRERVAAPVKVEVVFVPAVEQFFGDGPRKVVPGYVQARPFRCAKEMSDSGRVPRRLLSARYRPSTTVRCSLPKPHRTPYQSHGDAVLPQPSFRFQCSPSVVLYKSRSTCRSRGSSGRH